MSIHLPRKRARIRLDDDETSVKLRPVNPLQKQREQLPIARGNHPIHTSPTSPLTAFPGREALIREIQENDTTILLGETGSGKTTRAFASHHATTFAPHDSILSTEVPQYILESGIAGKGMIAVTQPRRVAATSLAARVAAEKNVSVGGLVGYSVRFDEASSSETRIKYVSDGMLVRELLSDQLLSRYSVIIVDEAHERTLRTDFLIANLKTIQSARNTGGDVNGKGKGPASALNPLKLIIMSATLDAEKFSRFYNKWVHFFSKTR